MKRLIILASAALLAVSLAQPAEARRGGHHHDRDCRHHSHHQRRAGPVGPPLWAWRDHPNTRYEYRRGLADYVYRKPCRIKYERVRTRRGHWIQREVKICYDRHDRPFRVPDYRH